MRVSPPDLARRAAFWAMLAGYAARGPEEGAYFFRARPDFAAYVQSLQAEERGLNLPPGWPAPIASMDGLMTGLKTGCATWLNSGQLAGR